MNSSLFKFFFVIIVIPNVIVMALERILDQYIIDTMNFCFSICFAGEMIVKLIALGVKGFLLTTFLLNFTRFIKIAEKFLRMPITYIYFFFINLPQYFKRN